MIDAVAGIKTIDTFFDEANNSYRTLTAGHVSSSSTELSIVPNSVAKLLTSSVHYVAHGPTMEIELGNIKTLADLNLAENEIVNISEAEKNYGWNVNGDAVIALLAKGNITSWTAEQFARVRGGIVTHNHPLEFGTISCSPADIDMARLGALQEIRAVSNEEIGNWINSAQPGGQWVNDVPDLVSDHR